MTEGLATITCKLLGQLSDIKLCSCNTVEQVRELQWQRGDRYTAQGLTGEHCNTTLLENTSELCQSPAAAWQWILRGCGQPQDTTHRGLLNPQISFTGLP